MELQHRPQPRPAATVIEAAFTRFLRLDVAAGNASPDTIRGYLCSARKWIEWCHAHGTDPVAATGDNVRQYRADLVAEGYKPGTIAHRLVVVRRLYAAARWKGLRPDNPAEGIKAPRERLAPEERIRYVGVIDLAHLFAAIPRFTAKGIRDRAILALMSLHGLRGIEIHRASTDDFNDSPEGPSLLVHGKSGERIVYLRQDVSRALTLYLETLGSGHGPDTAIFVSLSNRARGRRLSRRGVRSIVDFYLGKIGSGLSGSHVLRHTAATLALKGGAEINQIGAMLGHTDPRTTQRYAHVLDRIENNPADRIELDL